MAAKLNRLILQLRAQREGEAAGMRASPSSLPHPVLPKPDAPHAAPATEGRATHAHLQAMVARRRAHG